MVWTSKSRGDRSTLILVDRSPMVGGRCLIVQTYSHDRRPVRGDGRAWLPRLSPKCAGGACPRGGPSEDFTRWPARSCVGRAAGPTVDGVGEQPSQVRVQVSLGSGADAGEVEQQTLQLRDELLELDVDDVRQPQGESAPEGTRGAEMALLGTLVVTAGTEAVGAIVRTVASWLSRARGRSVRVELGEDSIELTDVSRADQRRLLEAFLERHAAAGA
jgi:hypothetical protein